MTKVQCHKRAGRYGLAHRRTRLVASGFLALGFCGALATPPNLVWQDKGPGLAYCHDQNPRIPLAVHVVRVDRASKDLELHVTMGGGNRIGLSVLSQQAAFIKPPVGQAVAAINGDYFYVERPFEGDPMNLMILRGGELVSGPGVDRAFFFLDARGEPHITNAIARFSVTWPGGKQTPIGLNEYPETGQAVLYTSAAGYSTSVEGVDLILGRKGQEAWLPLRIGQRLTAVVREVNKQGFSRIPADGMVLSLSPRTIPQLPPLNPGMEITISTATEPDLGGASLALGGGPSLVRGGKPRPEEEFRGFQRRDPRTAFGWNSRYYYLVQCDGRQPRYSMGMTLGELADYFVKLGCDYAINLDGGGSCTTWLDGRIVNSPSQRGMERPSANALVVVRKPKTP